MSSNRYMIKKFLKQNFRLLFIIFIAAGTLIKAKISFLSAYRAKIAGIKNSTINSNKKEKTQIKNDIGIKLWLITKLFMKPSIYKIANGIAKANIKNVIVLIPSIYIFFMLKNGSSVFMPDLSIFLIHKVL